MRRLLCDKCAHLPIHNGESLHEGTFEIYPQSAEGEPAEMARVMWGIAKTPQFAQRSMSVNERRYPLPLESYNCDSCGDDIKPGDVAWTLTVWQPSRDAAALILAALMSTEV